VRTVERSLIENRDCTDVLMLMAAVKGGINALMAEILEDHIRLHLAGKGAYLK
jgi:DNA-binding FrmR family transcriptional regulator